MAEVKIDIGAMQAVVSGLRYMGQRAQDLRVALWGCYGEALNASTHISEVQLWRLEHVQLWADDQVTPMQNRLDLARAIAVATITGFPATGPVQFGHVVTIDDHIITNLDDLLAAVKNGSTTDEQWQQILNLGNIDQVDPQIEGDQERYNREDAIRQWFAVHFYNNLTAEQAAGLITQLENQLPEDFATNPGYWADQNTDTTTAGDVYASKIEALGNLLGAATRSHHPPLDNSFKDQTIDLMTDPTTPLDTIIGISMLLEHGHYTPDFANDIANAVVDYEDDHGGYPEPWYKHDPSGGLVTPTAGFRNDPMVGVLGMFADSPDAAQQFFAPPPANQCPEGWPPVEANGQLIHINPTLAYLLNRNWGDDDFAGLAVGGSDHGAALGQALAAATTHYRNDDTTGMTSAAIATQLFAAIGDELTNPGQLTKQGWDMPDGMGSGLADILANYMPDIMRVAPEGHTSDDFSTGLVSDGQALGFPPDMPPGALLDKHHLEHIIQALGQGTNAVEDMQTVAQGWGAADSYIANHYLDTPGLVETSWDNQAGYNSRTLKFITDNAISGINDAAARDQLSSSIFSFGLSAAGQIPQVKPFTTTAGLAHTFWSDIISQATDPGNPAAEILTAQTSMINTAAANWLQALANHGYLPPEAIKAGEELGVITTDKNGNYVIHSTDYDTFEAWTTGPYNCPSGSLQDSLQRGLFAAEGPQ